jgi:hypothetical protein
MITVIFCDLYTIGCDARRGRWYHNLMKLFCALALAALAIPAAAVNPQLKQVSHVYILGMSSGMDQFLANQLTTAGVFQVVTDPQLADAILTDRIGAALETKLSELYPPPPAPEPAKKDDETAKGSTPPDISGAPARVGTSFNRGKGNFFLVDRRSRSVLWSVYELAKDSTPDEQMKVAKRVVKKLMDDLNEKK